MNYLQLCQRMRQESGGISGSGPTAVTNQVGEYKSVVDWVQSAYEDIQNLHPDWDFLRTDLSFQTIANASTYVKTAIGADEQGEWIPDSFRSYLTSGGVSGEGFMQWMSWDSFRNTYLIGSMRSTTGFPQIMAKKPDTSLIFWPIPNAAYTINGEYFKRPQFMTANTDIPIIPVKFHMIIVWRALMYYAGQNNAPEIFAVAQKEYRRLLNLLQASQLPQMSWAGALA